MLASVCVGTILLGGCGNNSDSQPTSETDAPALPADSTSEQVIPTSVAATSTAARFAGIGQQVRNQGIAITVHSVSEAPTIRFNESGYSGEYAEFTDLAARPGGKFVTIDTTVLNDTRGPIDITCSAPIQNSLFSEDRREYSTIDSQYNVEGNPGCNDMLQPGFDVPMKFIYELPSASVPLAFAFADRDAPRNAEPTFVSLGGS